MIANFVRCILTRDKLFSVGIPCPWKGYVQYKISSILFTWFLSCSLFSVSNLVLISHKVGLYYFISIFDSWIILKYSSYMCEGPSSDHFT